MEHPSIPGGCSRNIQHTAGSPHAWQGESLIVPGLTALSSRAGLSPGHQHLTAAAGPSPGHSSGTGHSNHSSVSREMPSPAVPGSPGCAPTINRMLLTDPFPPFSTVLSPTRGWETPEASPHSPMSHKPALKSSLGQAPSCGTHPCALPAPWV